MSVASVQRLNDELPHYLQPPVPSVFTLEITQRCNHNCIGCGNTFEHQERDMDTPSWATILARLRPFARALRITGGEPTLHPQFRCMMELADSLEIPFVLFTNGNWAEPKSIVEVLVRCSNLRGVLISLHGANVRDYRWFTGVDAFAKVQENIRQAANAGLRVATNTLLLTTTYQRLPEITDRAISLGASTVSFGRYYGEPISGLSLSADQLRSALFQIAELRRGEPRIVLSNCVPTCFFPTIDLGRGCTSGFTHCTIGPAGEVRPCTHTPLVLGYIQDQDIGTLWQSAALDAWRRLIPLSCLSCAALNRCRGGCRATAQQLGISHDPLIEGPLTDLGPAPIVQLPGEGKLRLSCSVETTSYGYALSGAGHFVTLSDRAGPILQALDGHLTAKQVQKLFGEGALQLVGSLAHSRLLQLE